LLELHINIQANRTTYIQCSYSNISRYDATQCADSRQAYSTRV